MDFLANISITLKIRLVSGSGTRTVYIDNVKLEELKGNIDGYRFGFNGYERIDEAMGDGNMYDFGARIYDPRLGRFFSIDPLTNEYPWNSPYAFALNSPIRLIDRNGEGPDDGTPDKYAVGDCQCSRTVNGVNTTYLPENVDVETIKSVVGTEMREVSKALTAVYGVRPYEYEGYLNTHPNGAKVRSLFTSIATASGGALAGELYTMSVGEGFFVNHLKAYKFDLDAEVSGFNSLGLDFFYSEYGRLKKYGHFPLDFGTGNFSLQWQNNEDLVNVPSANFTNTKSAIQAFAGVYNSLRDIMMKDAAALGYGAPTPDQQTFWTYVYFQGEGRGKKLLQQNGGFGWSSFKLDTRSQNPSSIPSKAYRRMVTNIYIGIVGF